MAIAGLSKAGLGGEAPEAIAVVNRGVADVRGTRGDGTESVAFGRLVLGVSDE